MSQMSPISPQYHDSIIRIFMNIMSFGQARELCQMTCPSCPGNMNLSASRPAFMTARTPWKCRVWLVAIPTWSMRHRHHVFGRVWTRWAWRFLLPGYQLDAVQTSFNGIHPIFHVPGLLWKWQVRLATQCDTSESDAVSRPAERPGNQTSPNKDDDRWCFMPCYMPFYEFYVQLCSAYCHFCRVSNHWNHWTLDILACSVTPWVHQVTFDCECSTAAEWSCFACLVCHRGCLSLATRPARPFCWILDLCEMTWNAVNVSRPRVPPLCWWRWIWTVAWRQPSTADLE